VTRFVHRFLFALLVALAVSAAVDALASAPTWARERPSPPTGDVLAVPHHADGAIVTMRSRLPMPGSAAVPATSRSFPLVAAAPGTRCAEPYAPSAPLYALLRVFRL
jgi:hypothetical protein